MADSVGHPILNNPVLGGGMKSPMIGLDVDAETATYIGVLETALAAYAIQEAKFRCVLEMITGETWHDTKLEVNGKALQDIAVAALVKKGGMSLVDAKVLVAKRWNKFQRPMTAQTPKRVPIEHLLPGQNKASTDDSGTVDPTTATPSVAERVARWRADRDAKSASAGQSTDGNG